MKAPRTVTVGYTYETEDNDYEFKVTGKIYPYIPAKTYGDPSQCYPAEGGDIEILDVSLQHESTQSDTRKLVELLFVALIDNDKKLRDHLYESISEEAAACEDFERCEWADLKNEELRERKWD